MPMHTHMQMQMCTHTELIFWPLLLNMHHSGKSTGSAQTPRASSQKRNNNEHRDSTLQVQEWV